VDGEIVGAIGLSGAPTVQNDVDCARAALAVVNRCGRGWLICRANERMNRAALVLQRLPFSNSSFCGTGPRIPADKYHSSQERGSDNEPLYSGNGFDGVC